MYADEVRGLFYGYGYVVAEDRLYQMEMALRAVLGTVSEVMGPAYLALDKGNRASFSPDSIRAQMARLPADDAAIFDGYAAGFNARVKEVLADKARLMPKQFIDAGFEPQAGWTGYDVAMIWVGTMANRYSNVSSEIANLRLLDQLSKARGARVGRQIFDQIRWIEDRSRRQRCRARLRARWLRPSSQPDVEPIEHLTPVSQETPGSEPRGRCRAARCRRGLGAPNREQPLDRGPEEDRGRQHSADQRAAVQLVQPVLRVRRRPAWRWLRGDRQHALRASRGCCWHQRQDCLGRDRGPARRE